MIAGNEEKLVAPKIFLGPHDVKITAISPEKLTDITEFNLGDVPKYRMMGKHWDENGEEQEVDTVRFVVFGTADTEEGPHPVSATFFMNLVPNRVSKSGNMEFINHAMQTAWYPSEEDAKLGIKSSKSDGYIIQPCENVHRTYKGEAAFSAFLVKWLGIRPNNEGLHFSLREYRYDPNDAPRNVMQEVIDGDFSFFQELVDYANAPDRESKVNLVLSESNNYQSFITKRPEAFGYGGFKNKRFEDQVERSKSSGYAFSNDTYTLEPQKYDAGKKYVNPCAEEEVTDDLSNTANKLGMMFGA